MAQNININRVSLNVGGTIFETTKSTLLGESALRMKSSSETFFSQLLQGKFECKTDQFGILHVFIDKDPDNFNLILKWLRNQDINCVGLTDTCLSNLLADVEFYQLEDMYADILSAKGFPESENTYPNVNAFRCNAYIDGKYGPHIMPIFTVKHDNGLITMENVTCSGLLVEPQMRDQSFLKPTLDTFQTKKCMFHVKGPNMIKFCKWYSNTFIPIIEQNVLPIHQGQRVESVQRYDAIRYDKEGEITSFKMVICANEAKRIKWYKNGEQIKLEEAFTIFEKFRTTIEFSPKCVWRGGCQWGVSFSIKAMKFCTLSLEEDVMEDKDNTNSNEDNQEQKSENKKRKREFATEDGLSVED